MESFQMLFGAVPFVLEEPIFRVQAVNQSHPLVPHHLSHNGGAGDGKGLRVSIHHSRRRDRAVFRKMKAVHQRQVGNHRQFSKSPDHRQMGGLVDPDPIDLFSAGGAHADGGGPQDRPVGRLPSRWS